MGNSYVEKQYKLLRNKRKELIKVILMTICIPFVIILIVIFSFAQNSPPEKWKSETFTLQKIDDELLLGVGRHNSAHASRLYGTNGKDYMLKQMRKEKADSVFEVGKKYTVYYSEGIAYSVIEAIFCEEKEIISYDTAIKVYKNHNKELFIILAIIVSIMVIALTVIFIAFRDNFRLIKKYKSNIKEKLNK